MLDAERGWLAIAAEQAGAVGREQMLVAGATGSTISRRVAEGRIRAVLPGVYVVAGSPDTTAQRRWVTLLAVGPAAVLSFETAARVHRVATIGPKGPTVVTVPHSGWQRLPGITVHQISDLTPDHVTEMDGFPVTTLDRTIVDLAAIWRRGRLRLVVEDAVDAGRTTDARLGTMLRSLARRGKPGVRTLTAVLDERGPGKAVPRSRLEREFLGLTRRSALPEPVGGRDLVEFERMAGHRRTRRDPVQVLGQISSRMPGWDEEWPILFDLDGLVLDTEASEYLTVAGVLTVGVPAGLTAHLPFTGAHHVVRSLTELDLDRLTSLVESTD